MVDEMTSQAVGFSSSITRQVAQLEDANEKISSFTQKLATLEGEYDAADREASKLREALTAAEARAFILEKRVQEVGPLKEGLRYPPPCYSPL